MTNGDHAPVQIDDLKPGRFRFVACVVGVAPASDLLGPGPRGTPTCPSHALGRWLFSDHTSRTGGSLKGIHPRTSFVVARTDAVVTCLSEPFEYRRRGQSQMYLAVK